MKWLFLLAIILAVPLLIALMHGDQRNIRRVTFILGAGLMIVGGYLWTAPIPWPTWPGPVKGLEISLVDSFSIALIMSVKPVPIPSWIKAAFVIFCASLVISTLVATQMEPSVFYAWQLARAVILFIAIARTSRAVEGAALALVAGLGIGLVYHGVLAVSQFLHGAQRPGGGFGYSNYVGLVSDFVTFPALALALGTRRSMWLLCVPLAGCALAVVGGSRATQGMFVLGVILTLVFSLRRGLTPRKTAFGVTVLFFLLICAPAMMWVVNNRSQQALVSSDADRKAMKEAARMMIADHPYGVGANQYVIIANTGGYSQRAGVPWNMENRIAPVHDTYYLVAAEFGVIGWIGFVMLFASLIALGLSRLKQGRGDTSELLPGVLATIIVVSIHISYEWIFMDFMLHYLFAIVSGILVGVSAASLKSRKTQAMHQPNVVGARLGVYP